MNLTDVEVTTILNSICSGCKYELIDKELFLFRHPSMVHRLKAEAIYTLAYEQAVADGIPTKQEVEVLIEKRKLFTEEDRHNIELLMGKIEAQKVLLEKTVNVKANQERIKNTIESLESEIRSINYKKSSILAMSADNKAQEEKILYLCWSGIFRETDTFYWESYTEFKNTTELITREKIILKYLQFFNGLDETTIRYIARHRLWRVRYITSQKTSDTLFGIPTSEYTNDMLNLASWSNYYDNIWQMMPDDRPDDSIIEDDKALDKYMLEYYKQRNNEALARKSKKKVNGSMSAFDSEEVIVTASHSLYKEIEYDKPREALRMKDQVDVRQKKRKKRSRR